MSGKVTMQHIRGAGICARGARGFFKDVGMDWNEFITNGLPVEQFEALNEYHHVKKVLEVYYGRK